MSYLCPAGHVVRHADQTHRNTCPKCKANARRRGKARPLSDNTREILNDLADNCDDYLRNLRGRSEHGGFAVAWTALYRRGLVCGGAITAAGLQAIGRYP